ncbi:MAG: hypothetical protein WBM44_16490, partial [Waterburya sp.]
MSINNNNFDDLLQIQNSQSLEENVLVSTQEAVPKSSKSLSQSSVVKLGLILAIVAVPVGVMMFFFGSVLNLKTSLAEDSSKDIKVKVEQSDAEIKQVQEENLKGQLAYLQQAEAIKNIEQQKLKPEIKLESQEPKPEIKSQPTSTSVLPQSSPVVRSYNPRPERVPKTQQRAIPKQVAKVNKAIQYDSMSDWQNLA